MNTIVKTRVQNKRQQVKVYESLVTNKPTKPSVAVIGLGYVGLPLACLAASKGCETVGIDINVERTKVINNGFVPFEDLELQKELRKTKLKTSADFSAVANSEIVVICVPTPIDKMHNPDLLPVKMAVQGILPFLRKGHLIILESTVNPGVCEEVMQPILEQSGLKAGIDFDIAHCPERISPGDKHWTVKNIPRVVGATSEKGLEKAYNFYSGIVNAPITKMKSIKAAEATKVIENTFRDINIAYVNELAKSFDKWGIDLIEVIRGASSKPFAFMPHFPGAGIGGHCIPVDPYYLIERAKQNGFDHKFLKLAREINNSMPEYTVEILAKVLNNLKKSVRGTKIAVLGITYKPDIDDTRESPSFEIIKHLTELGADLKIFDPHVPVLSTVTSLNEALEFAEVVVVATAHREFLSLTGDQLKASGITVVIDGRNCLDKEQIVNSGVVYKGIGR